MEASPMLLTRTLTFFPYPSSTENHSLTKGRVSPAQAKTVIAPTVLKKKLPIFIMVLGIKNYLSH